MLYIFWGVSAFFAFFGFFWGVEVCEMFLTFGGEVGVWGV